LQWLQTQKLPLERAPTSAKLPAPSRDRTPS